MAALLGVARGPGPAPRQPALVNTRDEPSTQQLVSKTSRQQNGASVHRHTRISRKSASASRSRRALHKRTRRWNRTIGASEMKPPALASANKLGQAAADGLRQSYSC